MVMLAMLAAAAHAARPAVRWTELGWLVGTLVFIVVVSRFATMQVEWVGVCLTIMAAWRLVRGGSIAGAMALAGASAGLGVALYVESGMNPVLAVALCLGAALLAVLFAREQRFATTHVRDFALLMVACCAPVVAMAPGVLAGWESARALNMAGENAATGLPALAWIVPVAALLVGGMRGFWKRR